MSQLFGSNTWPADHFELLKALWSQGLSASQTARAINRKFGSSYSRNAVIGKVHRGGLEMRGRREPSAPKGVKPSKSRPRTTAPVRLTDLRPPKPPTMPPEPVVVDATKAKPWRVRGDAECTWIIAGEGADAVCCAQPVHARGWCKAHYAVGTIPTSQKDKRNLQRLARVA